MLSTVTKGMNYVESPTESRSGTAHILMCPPHYFDVDYEINPWMNRRVSVDQAVAREQWDNLYQLLAGEIGAAVEIIDPVVGLPDFVFTANAGLLVGNTFIASNFRYPRGRGKSLTGRPGLSRRGTA